MDVSYDLNEIKGRSGIGVEHRTPNEPEKPPWRSGCVTRLVIQGLQVQSRASPVLQIETINRGPVSI